MFPFLSIVCEMTTDPPVLPPPRPQGKLLYKLNSTVCLLLIKQIFLDMKVFKCVS